MSPTTNPGHHDKPHPGNYATAAAALARATRTLQPSPEPGTRHVPLDTEGAVHPSQGAAGQDLSQGRVVTGASVDVVLADLLAGRSHRDPFDDLWTLAAEVRRLREINERLAGERADALDRAEEAERTVILSPAGLDGMEHAYGVTLSMVGEEGGAWLALGHVEPLRMIAAMRKIARVRIGIGDEETFGYVTPADGPLIGGVQHLRALFTASEEYGWFASWGAEAQADPRSVDVTVWS